MNPYVNEHGMPRLLSRKERRQINAQDNAGLAYARPNEQERPSHMDRCTQSKYQEHRFVFSPRLGTMACEFCHRLEQDCLVKGTR